MGAIVNIQSDLIKTLQVSSDPSLIAVGISACLMGDEVRYNGGHSRSGYCVGPLSQYFCYQKFCPEMAAGFGVPRPTLRLEGDLKNPRLVYSTNPEQDFSQRLLVASESALNNVGQLDGYIVMKNSPSCGLERVKVYQGGDNGGKGYPHKEKRSGLFTEQLIKRYPNLPVEEDGRLNDASLRENFILRVYAHNRFREQVLNRLSDKKAYKFLLDFHSEYKYIVMSHSVSEYKALGKLLAVSHKKDIQAFSEQYFSRLWQL